MTVKFERGGRCAESKAFPVRRTDCANALPSSLSNHVVESLIIDGIKAKCSMYEEDVLELEDYFWQFVEDFKANKNENYLAIARRLSSEYAADKQALQVMFKELQKKLQQKLNRDELELSIDDFDDLTASLIGLGKKRYYSVLKNTRSAMYLTNSTKNCYCVLNLLGI